MWSLDLVCHYPVPPFRRKVLASLDMSPHCYYPSATLKEQQKLIETQNHAVMTI
jgi:hypothetical protein